MADYISTLTGSQMDAALLDMAEHNSEAYAVGERNGIDVPPDDVTYHNNARYYAQQAQSIAPASVTEAVRWDIAQTALTDANKEQARENINAADNDTAVQVVAQTFTSAQQEIARANIGAGGTNPNLLDNPFFTINQRSVNGTVASGSYGLDRWISMNNAVTMKTGQVYGGVFSQRVTVFPDLIGKTLTVSVIANGAVVSGTKVLTDNSYDNFLTSDDVNIDLDTRTDKRFLVNPKNGAVITACKLELGSVSTLANDTTPDYGTELLKCQRYFIRFKKLYADFGFGFASTATIAYLLIPTPVPLRETATTLTVSFNEIYVFSHSGAAHAVSAVTVQQAGTAFNAAGVTVSATTTGLTSAEPCLLQSRSANGYLDISADL